MWLRLVITAAVFSIPVAVLGMIMPLFPEHDMPLMALVPGTNIPKKVSHPERVVVVVGRRTTWQGW